MPNNTGPYNEIYYAQTGLEFFKKTLRMAPRVNRSLGNAQRKGDQIKMRRPGSFVAMDAPSAAQALNPTEQYMTLDLWKETKTSIPDDEDALTAEQLLSDHIGPMINALGVFIDSALISKFVYAGASEQFASTFDFADIANCEKKLFDNLCPQDQPENMHFVMGSTCYAKAIKQLGAGVNLTGAGINEARQNANLINLFGFQPARSNNMPTYRGPLGADIAGALVGNHALNAATVSFDGVTNDSVFPVGATFTIAGDTTQYSLPLGATASAGGVVTAAEVSPWIQVAVLNDAVITFDAPFSAAKGVSLAFHRDFLHLGMAQLPMKENGNGIVMQTVTDPDTGLSLRYRRWVDGNNSATYHSYDWLGGIKVFNPNLAVRMYDY